MKFGILGNFKKSDFYNIFNELSDFFKENKIEFYLAKNKRLDSDKILYKQNIYKNEIKLL